MDGGTDEPVAISCRFCRSKTFDNRRYYLYDKQFCLCFYCFDFNVVVVVVVHVSLSTHGVG